MVDLMVLSKEEAIDEAHRNEDIEVPEEIRKRHKWTVIFPENRNDIAVVLRRKAFRGCDGRIAISSGNDICVVTKSREGVIGETTVFEDDLYLHSIKSVKVEGEELVLDISRKTSRNSNKRWRWTVRIPLSDLEPWW